MPTYDYTCDACGHEFEEFQSFSEQPLSKCPQCGKKKLRRLFGTGAGVIFKGSGFYETDYRSDSYKQAAKADQEKPASANGDGKAGTTESSGKSDASGSNTAPTTPAKTKSSGKSSKSAP
jgi:putative FmdB family regulatory protein